MSKSEAYYEKMREKEFYEKFRNAERVFEKTKQQNKKGK